MSSVSGAERAAAGGSRPAAAAEGGAASCGGAAGEGRGGGQRSSTLTLHRSVTDFPVGDVLGADGLMVQLTLH